MKIDKLGVVALFDVVHSSTDMERGYYWLERNRPDGLKLTFVFGVYEDFVDIIIGRGNVGVASLSLEHCAEVRISPSKSLEILREEKVICHCEINGKIFLRCGG